MLGADRMWPLHGTAAGAVTLADAMAAPEQAVVTAVAQPLLLGFAPEVPNGRAMLVLGGGGYVALMAGREGVQVARWLNALGYYAFVLIHRFPDADHGPSAPLDDALAAMALARASGLAERGLGVVGLSSGGHLAAWSGGGISACMGEARAAAARSAGGRLCADFHQCAGAHDRRGQASVAAGGKAGAL